MSNVDKILSRVKKHSATSVKCTKEEEINVKSENAENGDESHSESDE